MPSKTPKQAKFMRAIAHGWTPSRMKSPPSRAVAQEFVDADRKYSGGFAENRYWTGGLAAMDEVTAGGKRGSLNLFNWQEGGDVDYQVEPGVYEAPNVEEMGPALNQMFDDMASRQKGREEEWIDYAWDKTTSDPEKRTNIDDTLAEMSGPQQVEYVKPRLLAAMRKMKDIGESEVFKDYSMADYMDVKHQVHLWRSKWTQALQQQAREAEGEEKGMRRGGRTRRNGGGAGGLGGLTESPYTYEEQVKRDAFLNMDIQPRGAFSTGLYNIQQQNKPSPEPTIAGITGPSGEPVRMVSGPRGRVRTRGGRRGGRRDGDGPRGGGGPGPGGGPGGPGTAPPRIIPTDPASYVGGTPSGTSGGGGGGGSGEGSQYRKDLRQHQRRIENILGSARGGHVNYYQEGGAVPVRPGHAEGPNPYNKDDPLLRKSYLRWEKKHHIDPAPPPPPEPEAAPEDIPWYKRIAGYGKPTKTDEALAEMEEARGGRINYQTGGLAIAAPAGGVPPWIAPTGTGPGYMDEPPPGYQFGGIANRGQPAPAAPQPYRGVPPQRGMISRGAQPGGLAAMQQQAQQQRQRFEMPGGMDLSGGGPDSYNPDGSGGIHGRGTEEFQRRQAEMRSGNLMDRIGVGGGRFGEAMRRARNQPTYQDYVNSGGGFMPPTPGGGNPNMGRPGYDPIGDMGPVHPGMGPYRPGKPRPAPGTFPDGGEGITGGPRVPPNMRGYLQKQRMMNRPPSGPVGGSGGNRVGMADQQGALSRAMQRGTGRPPMSRRSAFGRAQ